MDLLYQIRSVQRPKTESVRKASQLRSQLVEESGKYKDIIADLTGVPKTLVKSTDIETKTDRWIFSLKPNFDTSSVKTLLRNIDITKQAVGKLKNDIEAGRRNEAGELIEVINKDKGTLPVIENIFNRFHIVTRQLRERYDSRPTLQVKDEYDVQDLMHGLLKLYFDDIRTEEWTPSYAGSSSRMDFLLKAEKIVVEVKKTRDTLRDREIGKQLIEDVAKYKEHPDCRILMCFVYDPGRQVGNPIGLEKDLARLSSSDLIVRVFIRPS
jgi:hypothetical protein